MIEAFINRTEVKEYLENARLFCECMESTLEVHPIEFLKKVRLLLLALYQKALVFPLYDIESDKETDDLLGDTYFTVLKLIGNKVGEFDFYNHIYDPTNLEDKKPCIGSLTDDLGDIYRDIKRALLQLDTNSSVAREDALWSLHALFGIHYGAHIINALYAIHFFLQYE